jgi:hypothetical protein
MKERHHIGLAAVGGERGVPATAAVAACLVPVVLGVLALGCYQPKVVSGKLKCALSTNACPDGFSCVAGVCVAPGSAPGGRGAAGGRFGMGGDGGGGRGAGGVTGGGGAGGAVCTNPVISLCAVPATSAACDPVCQTGCDCGLRCNVSNAGLGCEAATGTKTLGQLCQVAAQTTRDDCAPGLICLKEACGASLGRCYRFCRDSNMCGASGACAKVVPLPNGTPSGQRACDLTDEACDPYATGACPDPALHCYVTGPNQTTCDCPGMPGAEGQEGDRCSAYNDCAAGLACLQVAGASQCVRLCRSSADCASCAAFGSVSYCAAAAGG